MPRRSATEKAETHTRILRQASRSFRKHGGSVGIGDLMRDLGLTHGGFYRHFPGKDDLFVEAVSVSFAEVATKLEAAAAHAEPGRELEAIITAYLSPGHLAHPETWCALATLAPEIARLPKPARRKLDVATQQYMQRMAHFLPGRDAAERSRNFIVLFSGMAGAIAVARALSDRSMSVIALGFARDFYLRAFTATTPHSTRPASVSPANARQ